VFCKIEVQIKVKARSKVEQGNLGQEVAKRPAFNVSPGNPAERKLIHALNKQEGSRSEAEIPLAIPIL